jgi:hypothetical protein
MAIPPASNTSPPTTASFRPTALFGGAITANLPSSTIDASTLRPVPDSQEVWVQADPSGNELSIIFDILEYVDSEDNNDGAEAANLAALDIHLAEIITPGDDVHMLSRDAHVFLPHFPPGTPALAVAAEVSGPRTAGAMGLWVTLVRLKEKGTDLIVAVNVPSGSEGAEESVVMAIWESLEVKDWGLFG